MRLPGEKIRLRELRTTAEYLQSPAVQSLEQNLNRAKLHDVLANEPDVVEPAESDHVLQPSKQVSVPNVLHVGLVTLFRVPTGIVPQE